MKLPYSQKLKPLARELRKKGVLSEALLWNCLKRKQIKGYQFNRQKPIGNYIVDFFCGKLGLVIEIDGFSHGGKYEADKLRQEKLEQLGLSVLRFHDLDVKKNIYGILRRIESFIEDFEKEKHPP